MPKWKLQEKDLIDQRDQIMSTMENDPDVLAAAEIGHKGPVADYAKQLHRVELKQSHLAARRESLERDVKEARKQYEILKVKELRINDATMKALGGK